jgi:hypothetical protein
VRRAPGPCPPRCREAREWTRRREPREPGGREQPSVPPRPTNAGRENRPNIDRHAGSNPGNDSVRGAIEKVPRFQNPNPDCGSRQPRCSCRRFLPHPPASECDQKNADDAPHQPRREKVHVHRCGRFDVLRPVFHRDPPSPLIAYREPTSAILTRICPTIANRNHRLFVSHIQRGYFR